MNVSLWLAVGMVLIVEGLGPMVFPKVWRKMIQSMTQLPDGLLRRFGGGLVVAGVVIFFMVSRYTGH
ncbi:DUF2065 domain-containing protein [Rouxiella badensis]|jgi:uncharacterized protein YjeT (DUF2065 family)|uniref:DUF2065 domain-containing protein n=1 Tax=Rouxiella badensis TaxID=1646377 RepID=A0A1X0WEC3_9GAMM|nr:DUF2065 domain-containing protein [Rouxiella badensis]MCC3704858.1 DUF2065 domain-containing protein [Rouxiella badensis]MCC3719516.1 DUF2065 domain-containing protein [Rouxiella badensis]MCC3728766.1 DUF2065 domain-containing protein [Rouxiella badensis]MCC3733192.1 DUF2065 domain-containing protein [Rouxiella badensis]MCC3741038.1 DUF2065 domain-containing protein [Rouxiella badensis]